MSDIANKLQRINNRITEVRSERKVLEQRISDTDEEICRFADRAAELIRQAASEIANPEPERQGQGGPVEIVRPNSHSDRS